MDGMEAGHEGAPAGRADRIDVVVVQDHPGVGQCVNVRRGDLVGAVKSDVIPTLNVIKWVTISIFYEL